jgi:hypothetical protein
MATRIIVNGVEYPGVDAMPPDVRAVYERTVGRLADQDCDGVPDLVQAVRAAGGVVEVTETHHSTISVNGKTYDRVEDMPPSVRRLYEATMSRTDVLESVTPRISSGSTRRGPTLTMTFSPLGLLLLLLLFAVVVLVALLLLRR